MDEVFAETNVAVHRVYGTYGSSISLDGFESIWKFRAHSVERFGAVARRWGGFVDCSVLPRPLVD